MTFFWAHKTRFFLQFVQHVFVLMTAFFIDGIFFALAALSFRFWMAFEWLVKNMVPFFWQNMVAFWKKNWHLFEKIVSLNGGFLPFF